MAPTPGRAGEAERARAGAPATRERFEQAADLALADARPSGDNAFKIPLVRRTLVRTLVELTATNGSAFNSSATNDPARGGS